MKTTMKTTLMTTIAVATLLIAGASVAQDFHPVLDADYLGELGANEPANSKLDLNNPGPHFDADWDGETPTRSSVLVAASFHDLLGADILEGQDSICSADYATAAEICSASCTVACSAH